MLAIDCYSRHHPYVAQVIGYSHPSLAERFYVMDAGMHTASVHRVSC